MDHPVRRTLRVSSRLWTTALLVGVLACGGEERDGASLGAPDHGPSTERAGDEGDVASGQRDGGGAVPPDAAARCGTAAIPVYEDGAIRTTVCPDDAASRGLTVIDLRPDWTPGVFTEDPSLGPAGQQPYRSTLLALADENFAALPEDAVPERFLELFGVFPTLRVVHQRLTETDRHACRAGVSDINLGVLDELLRPWGDRGQKQARVRQVDWQRHRLEQARERLGLATIHELATDERYGDDYRRYERERIPVDAVRELVEHLRCEGLAPERFTDGVFDGHLVDALIVFQRRHMVTNAGFVDTPTREAFLRDSLDADFVTLLRVLRERVVGATGLIEDGSASQRFGMVMGHKLDTAEFLLTAGHAPPPNAAADLISQATESAAQALGWTDASAATRALGQLLSRGDALVAMRLPPLPAYHSDAMDLRVEVHRGDVYYDYPYTNTGAQIHQPSDQRPVFTLYVTHEGQELALIRWATTIGGWKTERTPGGGVGMSYKDSPVGERIMRDIIASPAWLPPPSTPHEDMVRRVPGVGYRANNALFGPSYRSAYGMVMLMHHRVMPTRDQGDPPRIHDEGIRTHGSVSYRSIVRGTSHGCHRLYNHLAVRLASFVLAHRSHQRHGSIAVRYVKRFNHLGSYINFRIDSRGYRYELTPPLRVDVLEGTIRGSRRAPVEGVRRLAGSAAAAAVTDTAD